MSQEKIRVLFVCLGNICRSPMAEAVFRDMVRREGLADRFVIDSAGLGGWHEGDPPHIGTRERRRKVNPSALWSRSNARTTRFDRSHGTARSVSTANVPVSSTSSSRWRASAAANTSKPGPRLAEEAGTRTRRRRFTAGEA